MADNTALFRQWAPRLMAKLMADFGMTVEDAAAVLGNLGHESGGFRCMQELRPLSGRGGLGIAQWTGSRRINYERWLARTGTKPTDFMSSYAFMWRELTGQPGESNESRAVPLVKRAAGLRNKVIAFELGFERAHKDFKHYDSRMKWAQIALAAYQAAPVVALPTATPLEVKPVPSVVVPTPAVLPSATPKGQLQSRGIQGAILTGIGTVITGYLVTKAPALSSTWEMLVPTILGVAATGIGGVMSYFGRKNATQPIAGTESAAEAKVQQAVAATDRATVLASEQSVFVPDTLGQSVSAGSITDFIRQGVAIYDQVRPMATLGRHFVSSGTPLGKILDSLDEIDNAVAQVKAALDQP